MKSHLSTYWRGLANGTRTAPLDRLLLVLLSPLAFLYARVQGLRAGLYRSGVLKTRRLPRPVVSIGNITVGGTGKTPLTAFISLLLLEHGARVAVLTRGYGGSMEGQTAIVSDGREILLNAQQCGDEPYLLASTVPGVMVVMGSDRHAAGLLAMERLAPDIFLLDDGFQHLALHRDLNILLLDCARPFGNGRTLPAGLLREPLTATQRADLVVHTRCPEGSAPDLVVTGKPRCIARHRLGSPMPLSGGTPLPFAVLAGHRIVAFAGIADPTAFFAGLAGQGVNLVRTLPFPDHVSYDGARIAEVEAAMADCGAQYAITTEKDGVKLRHLAPALAHRIMLAPLELTLDDPAPLTAALYYLLQK
jgi:tetraacyldisaccharide 4'-kinase